MTYSLQLAAFVLMVSWSVWSLITSTLKAGKKQNTSILSCMTSTVLSIGLLYLGGFFVQLGWPQIAWAVITLVGVFCLLAGYFHEQVYSLWNCLFANAIIWFLYIKGGFWCSGFSAF